MPDNRDNSRWSLHVGHDPAAAPARAGEHILDKHALEERGPVHAGPTSRLPHDDAVWAWPEPQVRRAAELIFEGVMAALFLGLVQEITARPATLTEWGDTGQALTDVLPRARTVLRRAMATLLPRIRNFLEAYQACHWNLDRFAQKLRVHARKVNERCDEAMGLLGEALRAELDAGASGTA